ncbi:MAG: hypothetical protein GXP34_11835 [Actinobacteria bacterium]|nr:hypothetical protein [Actinomycetota bacterium]
MRSRDDRDIAVLRFATTFKAFAVAVLIASCRFHGWASGAMMPPRWETALGGNE